MGKVKSPCKLVCKYDENKVCVGCNRTMNEIVNWINYSEEEKQLILGRIAKEKNKFDNYYGFP